jgi:hypothetical protein
MEYIDNFTIRAYTKKELALLYFPDSTPGTAVKHLMVTIRRNDMLWDELQAMGYYNRRKTFTPREVKAICDWLGAP